MVRRFVLGVPPQLRELAGGGRGPASESHVDHFRPSEPRVSRPLVRLLRLGGEPAGSWRARQAPECGRRAHLSGRRGGGLVAPDVGRRRAGAALREAR